MINWLLNRFADRVMRRDPDKLIGGREHPYLVRWHVIPRNRWLNVYLHLFLRSDDDRALHDHPWRSLSYMIRGRAWEVSRGADGTDHERKVETGQWVYRPAAYTHRMVIGRPAVTLFLTGPKEREWGFHCPKGWRHWREYSAPDDTGMIGRGCD